MLGDIFSWVNGLVLEFGKIIDDSSDKPVMGTQRKDNPFDRRPGQRKYFFDKRSYSPLFGTPGEIDHPTTISGKANLPVMPQLQAPQILRGPAQGNPIIDNDRFWLAYHSRKNRAYNWTYDDKKHLTEEHYPWKQAGIFNDNRGTVTYSGSRTPKKYDTRSIYNYQ